MSQQWCVKAWAGSYSWTVKDDDPAGYGLAGPLSVTRSLPETDLAPMVQPNADTASFRVIVATTAALDQLQLGDPVTLRYFPSRVPAGTDKPTVEFMGRVSTLDAEPHDLGMLYTVGCVDYTADLGEGDMVGTYAYPAETLDARVRRILADAGFNVPAGVNLYGGSASLPIVAQVAARPIAATTALELLTHTLAQFRLEFTGFPAVGVAKLRQVTTPDAGVATYSSGPASRDDTAGPYWVQTVFRSPTYQAPLRVSLVGGVYLLTGSTAQSNPGGVIVVDAGRVTMGTKFQQRKGDAVNAISVQSDSFAPQTAKWAGVAQRIKAAVQTELTSAADGALLATAYLTPVKPTQAALWVADTFTWLLDYEPTSTWGLPALGRGFMVVRVKGTWSPLEREWYVGQCSSVTFLLDGGVPSAVLGLSPWFSDPAAAANPVKWSDLAAGMTYANMSTRDTFTDYGLAGV